MSLLLRRVLLLILPNVVRPAPRGDAVLSQRLPQQMQEFLATDLPTFDQVHDQPHVRQQGRVGQRRFVQHDASRTQFNLLRPLVRQRFVGGRRRRIRLGLRQVVGGTGTTAGIETFLLRSACGRLIVGGTPLARSLAPMVLSAAERTTQVLAAGVPRVREKANSATSAGADASLQWGMRLDGGVQRDQVLLNQRLGAIVLMPI
ncbi:MAG: hypothetical protein WCK89_16640 [bacterium]